MKALYLLICHLIIDVLHKTLTHANQAMYDFVYENSISSVAVDGQNPMAPIGLMMMYFGSML